jgi:serine/threonine protein kinase/nitrite reductase/ring-hydroxylating ferredoxin subunit
VQTLHQDQLVGRTLGEYRIERLLGHAQLGAAYLARQLSHGRTVMLSTFKFPEGLTTVERNELTARLASERAVLTRLTHPYILPIYDFGEQSGYLYMVTAFVKGASLNQALKQQSRFTPDQVLKTLKLLGIGLDYAHNQGAVHGILILSNVLINNELTVQIAGFGLRTMLEVQEYSQNTHPPTNLFNAHGVLLGSPEYTSPECILGGPVDARSDIYALGVMLFKLLSGTLPFNGKTLPETAMQRVQQPAPSIHRLCPDVPEALDLVISKALERDPARRYQHAGDIADAFERVLTMLDATHKGNNSSVQQLAYSPQFTLPPTVNWFDEEDGPSNQWQLVPPIVTGHMPAVTSSSSFLKANRDGTESKQLVLPTTATQPDALTEVLPTKANGRPDSMAGVDPFAWWSATSDRPTAPPPTPGTFTRRAPHSNSRSRRYPARQDRRKLITLMVAGTAGVLTVGGISFAHLVQSMKQSPSRTANVPTTGPSASTTTQGNTPTVAATTGTQTTPTPSGSPTAKPSPSATRGTQPSPTTQPTQQPTPKPTQPPAPTPTQPSHTGTVIGHTNMATNSSAGFTNPADGQASLLIHLGNGNFVACEQACTHAGVPVNYDSGSGRLVCPAHNAIFDPANGFSVVSGPAPKPLPGVSIRVNADGTITTG